MVLFNRKNPGKFLCFYIFFLEGGGVWGEELIFNRGKTNHLNCHLEAHLRADIRKNSLVTDMLNC